MCRIFSKERVNTSRQLELDLVKAVMIILMIWIHVYEEMSTEFAPSLSYLNAYVTGSMTVAVGFMFLMGMGLSYSRNASEKACLRRGLELLTTGFALELFRTVLPFFLEYLLWGSKRGLCYLVLGLSSDILEFAGLAFLLMALLKHLKVSSLGMLVWGLVLSCLGTVLEGVSTGIYPLDQVLGFFWGTYSESYFPLLNWFVFVSAGLCYGEMYQFLENKTRFHLVMLVAGGIACALYLYLSFCVDQDLLKALAQERYLAHRPIWDALFCLPVNMGIISLFYFIGLLIPRKAVPVLTHPGRRICSYYCVSWVLISFAGMFLIQDRLSTDGQVVKVWIMIAAATAAVILTYDRFLKNAVEAFFARRRMWWAALAWIICIASFVWAVVAFDAYPNFLNGYSAG